ncbi:MAG: pyrroline-5-carboxylate reductase [Bacteroidetes bacterium]|nr:pyrroline-5-carboxylate reductase [Bacteroidota bacterium]
MLNKNIAIIGAGNMGTALIRGILAANLTSPQKIFASGTRLEKLETLQKEIGIAVTTNNKEVAKHAEIIILCVKAYVIRKVLEEMREVLHKDQFIISIAAGVTTESIEKLIGKNIPVVRCMPNIACTVGLGATAVSFGKHVHEKQHDIAVKIFEATGEVVVVSERHLDAVTGLSGSGPAYIYMVIEALIDGGVKMGMPRDISTKLAIQTVLGSAKLVKDSNVHPAILRDQVTTPGGTTINAIHELESHGLRSMLIDAVATATIRSKELSELINK